LRAEITSASDRAPSPSWCRAARSFALPLRGPASSSAAMSASVQRPPWTTPATSERTTARSSHCSAASAVARGACTSVASGITSSHGEVVHVRNGRSVRRIRSGPTLRLRPSRVSTSTRSTGAGPRRAPRPRSASHPLRPAEPPATASATSAQSVLVGRSGRVSTIPCARRTQLPLRISVRITARVRPSRFAR